MVAVTIKHRVRDTHDGAFLYLNIGDGLKNLHM